MTEETKREATVEEIKRLLDALRTRSISVMRAGQVFIGPGDSVEFVSWVFRNAPYTPRISAAVQEVFGIAVSGEPDDSWISYANRAHREMAETFLRRCSSGESWIDASSEHVKTSLVALLDEVASQAINGVLRTGEKVL